MPRLLVESISLLKRSLLQGGDNAPRQACQIAGRVWSVTPPGCVTPDTAFRWSFPR
jgi:hypothetical protein